jgi:exodeoxyribonuclease VII small subunit
MNDAVQAVSFETALAELENVLRDLEDGAIPLEDALAKYERAVVLLRSCYQRLDEAEQRIQELAGLDDEGRPQLRPFVHETSVAADPAEGRRRRKAERPSP